MQELWGTHKRKGSEQKIANGMGFSRVVHAGSPLGDEAETSKFQLGKKLYTNQWAVRLSIGLAALPQINGDAASEGANVHDMLNCCCTCCEICFVKHPCFPQFFLLFFVIVKALFFLNCVVAVGWFDCLNFAFLSVVVYPALFLCPFFCAKYRVFLPIGSP